MYTVANVISFEYGTCECRKAQSYPLVRSSLLENFWRRAALLQMLTLPRGRESLLSQIRGTWKEVQLLLEPFEVESVHFLHRSRNGPYVVGNAVQVQRLVNVLHLLLEASTSISSICRISAFIFSSGRRRGCKAHH